MNTTSTALICCTVLLLVFIDGILKSVAHNMDAAAKVLAEIDKIAGNSVEVVVTVSADQASLPEGIKKYL